MMEVLNNQRINGDPQNSFILNSCKSTAHMPMHRRWLPPAPFVPAICEAGLAGVRMELRSTFLSKETLALGTSDPLIGAILRVGYDLSEV